MDKFLSSKASGFRYKALMYNHGNKVITLLILINYFSTGEFSWWWAAIFAIRYYVEGTLKGKIMYGKETGSFPIILAVIDYLIPLYFVLILFI